MEFEYLGNPEKTKYFPAKKDGKFGYIDSDLNINVPFKYEEAFPYVRYPFSDFSYLGIVFWYGHAIVKNNGMYGVLDVASNTEVLPCEFDMIHLPFYCNNKMSTFWPRPNVENTQYQFVFVAKNDKWGVYKTGEKSNKEYQKVIPCEYKYIWGLYPNSTIVHAKKFNNKYSLLALDTGDVLIDDLEDVKVGNDYYGYFPVKFNGYWGVFNTNCSKVTHNFKYISVNEFPLAKNKHCVKVTSPEGKIGIVNINNYSLEVVPPKFDNVLFENNSFITVQYDKKGIWENGKAVVPCEYDYIENITREEGNDYFIVRKFKNGKFGVYDKNKGITPEFIYDKIKVINNKLKKNKKDTGYLDTTVYYDAPILFGFINNKWIKINLE